MGISVSLGYGRSVAESPIPLGEVFAGKYRVDRVIGEGGMGVVVAAQHLELEQPVAVKFLLDDLSQGEEGAERFRREARAAAKIQSDNVVRVIDVGTLPNNVHYMVMEFLDGQDLAAEIEEKYRIPIGLACTYLLEAIDAIAHAHSVGIIHRDLKPANLFLTRRPDGSRRVKVVDFGISKSVGASAHELTLTKTSAWIGSPLYMAPEQMQSAKDVDIRADVWSLGAIVYEMIAGRPPYVADSLPQLCSLLLTEDAVPLSTRCPEVPAPLSEAIMSCLQREPAKRCASTAPLARALKQFATTDSGIPLPSAEVSSQIFRSQPSLDHAETALLSDSAEAGLTPELNDALRTLTGLNTPAGVVDTDAVEGATQASWGGTGAGQREGSAWSWGKKISMSGAALAVLLASGFFFMRLSLNSDSENNSPAIDVNSAQPASEEPPVLKEQVVKTEIALQPELTQVTQVDSIEANTDPEALEKPQTSAVDKVKTKKSTARQIKSRPAKSSSQAESSKQSKSSKQASVETLKPAALQPKPTPKPRPRPVKKTREPADDFADFGGRR